MVEKNNAKCSICGKDYYMCLSCKDTMSAHPWKMFCDTAIHYQIFQVLRGYNTGVYTKDEARTKLTNISLEDIEDFKPYIKEIIEDILKEEKSTTEITQNINSLVEEKIVIDDGLVVEKPINSRKRNYKINKEIETE